MKKRVIRHLGQPVPYFYNVLRDDDGRINDVLISPDVSHADLVRTFNTYHLRTLNSLRIGDSAAAAENYKKALELFNQINTLRIDAKTKQQMYERTKALHEKLSRPSMVSTPLVAGVVIVLLAVVFFSTPAFTGFVGLETNHEPVFTGRQEIVIAPSTQITLDMHDYFEDPDGDALTFLATQAPHLDVEVSQNQVLLHADYAFESATIKLIASDLEHTTVVAVDVLSR